MQIVVGVAESRGKRFLLKLNQAMQNLIDFFRSFWWRFTLFEEYTFDWILFTWSSKFSYVES